MTSYVWSLVSVILHIIKLHVNLFIYNSKLSSNCIYTCLMTHFQHKLTMGKKLWYQIISRSMCLRFHAWYLWFELYQKCYMFCTQFEFHWYEFINILSPMINTQSISVFFESFDEMCLLIYTAWKGFCTQHKYTCGLWFDIKIKTKHKKQFSCFFGQCIIYS